MIHASCRDLTSDDWQRELGQAISEPRALLEALRLPSALLPAAERAASDFPLRVTRHFVSLMRPGDPDDPLLRQVLPLGAEFDRPPGYVDDPVGDRDALTAAGLLQKYRGRALLLTTGACAVHCRYCFRRHFPYAEQTVTRSRWRRTLAEIAARPELDEVILSGGDPLSLSDARLGELIDDLGRIPHLRRLRLHTRVPVVLPQRLSAELIALLAGSRLDVVLILHVNHPREIAPALLERLSGLRSAPATLLNQAVLLHGVNDSAATLCDLSEALFAGGVLPYYLHQLDPVAGAAHFAVPDRQALRLIEDVRARLPGYLVPQLVREVPGQASKLPLAKPVAAA